MSGHGTEAVLLTGGVKECDTPPKPKGEERGCETETEEGRGRESGCSATLLLACVPGHQALTVLSSQCGKTGCAMRSSKWGRSVPRSAANA
eukprot:2551857-Rhodomonas_salina.1